MIKKLLGIAPRKEPDGSYSPSPVSLRLATSETTGYEAISYDMYEGKKSKILVILTEHKDLIMQNGKKFSTGNHPVETLVPMLHLRNAGFTFEIATPTGQPVIFEMWAFPEKDQNVKGIYKDLKHKFDHPRSLTDFISEDLSSPDSYAAIFIPGGHGAMIHIPEDPNVDKVLRWAHDNDLYTISICHGPGSFLSTTLDNQTFLYDGYEMAVFPDSVDAKTPMIGYLPGKMPHGLSEPLKRLGAKVMNSKADDTVHKDRRLITGASPEASNALGKLAASTLLEDL